MFETLTGSFQRVFKKLRGYGKLTEKNIQEALREVRMALLEADVNYKVVKDFITKIREQCLGDEVLDSVTPGQQVIKRVYDEMTALLGGSHTDIDMSRRPASVVLLGLHGSGKTTTAAKLARKWKKGGRNIVLAACDIRRPAAVDQLRVLGQQVGVTVVGPEKGDTVRDVAARARTHAEKNGADVIIYDTGGRFQIDTELVQELKEMKKAVDPENAILVLDAAIGQESVHVAETFHKEVGLTGLILTKLDGDARGGAALSVQAVTGCPILLVGTGEKPEDLEDFYPERMASRILGMGDVVSLVERAQESVNAEEMAEMEAKLLKNAFDLNDFARQLQQMKKLGPIQNLMEMMPKQAGMPTITSDMADFSEKEMKKTEAIIQSMTPRERSRPDILNAGRKRRIAFGSGTEVRDVNNLLKNFDRARKMAQQLKKTQKRLLRFSK
ncbi:MAG: signal recognition particle protein [Verrucomicrobia bacterium]|nr:signal recognition particle protein [Verrucomicrobiota bacterium]